MVHATVKQLDRAYGGAIVFQVAFLGGDQPASGSGAELEQLKGAAQRRLQQVRMAWASIVAAHCQGMPSKL